MNFGPTPCWRSDAITTETKENDMNNDEIDEFLHRIPQLSEAQIAALGKSGTRFLLPNGPNSETEVDAKMLASAVVAVLKAGVCQACERHRELDQLRAHAIASSECNGEFFVWVVCQTCFRESLKRAELRRN